MDDGIPSSGMWIYLIPKAQLGASLLDLLKYAGKSAFMVAGCANIHNDGDVVGDGFVSEKGQWRAVTDGKHDGLIYVFRESRSWWFVWRNLPIL